MQESNMKTLKIKFTYLRFYFFFRISNILQHPLYNHIVLGFHLKHRQAATEGSTVAQQVDWISHSIVVKVNAAF